MKINTDYRKIEDTGKIPYQSDLELISKLDNLESKSSHHNLPIVWNRAEDFSVFDRHRNKYIDFSSGIFVTNSGHKHLNLSFNNMNQLLYSYSFPTEIKLKFLEKLTQFTGFEKAVLMNTGTEAVENAIKIMRLYQSNKNILSFRGGMHGKSQLTLNLRDNDIDYQWISEDTNIYHLEYPFDCQETSDWYTRFDDIAGIIIESYRGWDAQFFEQKYIQDLVKWAKQNKILVCFDEIQAGFGRTGKLFGYQHYSNNNYKIKPDLVCIGKALGNGIPISAVLSNRDIIDKADSIIGDFSSTYGGNPLSCSLSLANLEYMEDEHLIEESERKGKILYRIKEFTKYDIVDRVNSQGLVGAIVFKNREIADEVCMRCLKNGLILVKTGRESVKIGPPLTISDEALIEGIYVIENVIKEIEYSIVENTE